MDTEQTLEVNQIKEKLCEFAYTEKAKEQIINLEPMMSITQVQAAQRETSEARLIIEKQGNPPLTKMENVAEYLTIANKGGCLSEEQLEHVERVLATVKRLKEYLNGAKYLAVSLPYYEENFNSLEDVRNEILRMIRNGKVDDFASKELKSIRASLEKTQQKMREKADSILKNQKQFMADQFSTIRNGHICVPVKKESRNKVSGSVMDTSSTGNTLFIEPSAVASLSTELDALLLAEENEVRRILYSLTAMLCDEEETFAENQRQMEKMDFLFAKGKLSLEMNATEPHINTERTIQICKGRHPLMNQAECVPLDFAIGGDIKGMVITGPNTGGKTVCIKTVGLVCYMAQCGLHVTCEKADVCMNNLILCDIGDGQNISENLSTFSAHIKNVLHILALTGTQSLIIMDELGSGTDPTEGMGIAIAILEQLRKMGALFLVTSHYPEVKNYAQTADGIVNARMTFDRESLQPLYQLEIGQAGESCALYIAKKLGMPQDMLRFACEAAYHSVDEAFIETAELKTIHKVTTRKLEETGKKVVKQEHASTFHRGDSVMVLPDKKIGIVCEESNEKGMLKVQLKNEKIMINHKRIKLLVEASQLYPEDYDFSIIFDTVEHRKAVHDMSRKYCEETIDSE